MAAKTPRQRKVWRVEGTGGVCTGGGGGGERKGEGHRVTGSQEQIDREAGREGQAEPWATVRIRVFTFLQRHEGF